MSVASVPERCATLNMTCCGMQQLLPESHKAPRQLDVTSIERALDLGAQRGKEAQGRLHTPRCRLRPSNR